jgi:hypothetical protein
MASKLLKKNKNANDKVVRIALHSGVTHHAALANERSGIFLMGYGNDDWAQDYLKRAYVLYSEWGVYGKVEKRKKDYSFLDASLRTTNISSHHEQATID